MRISAGKIRIFRRKLKNVIQNLGSKKGLIENIVECKGMRVSDRGAGETGLIENIVECNADPGINDHYLRP